jgi:hypothetical protein
MTRFALLLTVLAACSKDNPYYCEDSSCAIEPDAMGSGSNTGCEDNADCSGATPVCETGTGACVACTSTENTCGGTTPVCSTTNSCISCVAHTECSSEACLPDGSCGDDSKVAYVATAGADTGTCTRTAPCATIAYAASQRSFVKLQSTVDQTVTLNNANVTVLGSGTAAIKRTTTIGAVVTVSGVSNVTFKDVVIREAVGTTGHGILVGTGEANVTLTLDNVSVVNNAGLGLSIGGGTLNMSRSLVAANNGGGGLIGGADFEITNTMFVRNGTASSTYGGLQITAGVTKKLFSFNTIAENDSTSDAGITCVGTMTVSNSIVAGNAAATCTFEYTLFDTAVTGSNTNNNKVGDPMFLNKLAATPLAADFFRIGATSAAKDSAAATSTVMTDIDGDARPQNGVRDMGADEFK